MSKKRASTLDPWPTFPRMDESLRAFEHFLSSERRYPMTTVHAYLRTSASSSPSRPGSWSAALKQRASDSDWQISTHSRVARTSPTAGRRAAGRAGQGCRKELRRAHSTRSHGQSRRLDPTISTPGPCDWRAAAAFPQGAPGSPSLLGSAVSAAESPGDHDWSTALLHSTANVG
jgi:hypothetical protein